MADCEDARRFERWLDEAPAGDWEIRARRLGMLIRPIRGLHYPRAIVADGCPPILLVGADVAGREREYQFAWLIGEVYARVLGEPCVVHEIERAMRTLLQAG